MRKKLACLLASVLLPTAAACGGGDDRLAGPRVPPDPRENVLRPGTTVLTPELADVADVGPDRISFPPGYCKHFEGLASGSIILADRQSPGSAGNNPKGFIRQLKAVLCGDRVEVETEPGHIEDAVDGLKFDWGFDLPACQALDDRTLGASFGGTLFSYSGVAETASGAEVPFTASAALDAAVCLAPKFKVKADVGFLKVRSFEAIATGDLESRLLLSAKVEPDASVDAATLAELASTPLTKHHTAMLVEKDVPITSLDVGIFRLPATVHYEATLSCEFTFTAPVEAEVGARATGTMTGGIVYEEGKLRPVYADAFELTPVPPTFQQDGMLRATCTVTPKIELQLFDVATASLTTRAYGGLGAAQTCGAPDAEGVPSRDVSGDVNAGASASIHAKLDIFGLKKWERACTLFDVSGVVPYRTSYPSPGAPDAACMPTEALPLPPAQPANPAACFGDEGGGDDGPTIIVGECTHDVCTHGEKLGQQCDDCTMKVCAVDPYCCDTYWGISCFEQVEALCGRTCDLE
jgi:hypothetical protein